MKNSIPDFEKEWRGLTITDDYMFGRVFSDKNLCKKLIELLLGVKVKSLSVPPEYQKTLQTSPAARGVRFDVYTESKNDAFDIEMQNFLTNLRHGRRNKAKREFPFLLSVFF